MINLKDTEVWSDFRKASKASEEDRDKMVEEIIEFALMHYSDKKNGTMFNASLSSGDSKVILFMKKKRNGKFVFLLTSMSSEGYKHLEEEDLDILDLI